MHAGIPPAPGRHRPQQTATAADGTHPTGMDSCGKFTFDIDVNEKGSFLERKCVKHSQVSVLTELVVSGTQCSTGWDGWVRTAFVVGPP